MPPPLVPGSPPPRSPMVPAVPTGFLPPISIIKPPLPPLLALPEPPAPRCTPVVDGVALQPAMVANRAPAKIDDQAITFISYEGSRGLGVFERTISNRQLFERDRFARSLSPLEFPQQQRMERSRRGLITLLRNSTHQSKSGDVWNRLRVAWLGNRAYEGASALSAPPSCWP